MKLNGIPFGAGIAGLAVAIALPLVGAMPAIAQQEPDVPRVVVPDGTHRPYRIAIQKFRTVGDTGDSSFVRDVETLVQIVAADLRSSLLFQEMDRNAFPSASTVDFNVRPDFKLWRSFVGNGWLLSGEAILLGSDRVQVRFRLWDLVSGRQEIGLQLEAPRSSIRRLGHRVADSVYNKITHEQPYFDSRIAFTEESGPKGFRQRRLAVMDYDGANVRYLTRPGKQTFTPRFSPSRQQLAYVSFDNQNRAQVYLADLETGRYEFLGQFDGLSFSPRFSPDGRKLAISISINGNTDIYEIDLGTRERRRLTTNVAIDTAPCYSPDGDWIVFESDRGSGKQIYKMPAGGERKNRPAELLTAGGADGDAIYGTPVWSPRGDLIAFTKQYKRQFHIGVMDPDGRNERIIHSDFHAEGPTWAPNGRVLMYYREYRDENQLPSLYSLDISLKHPPQVIRHDASDPAWSSLVE